MADGIMQFGQMMKYAGEPHLCFPKHKLFLFNNESPFFGILDDSPLRFFSNLAGVGFAERFNTRYASRLVLENSFSTKTSLEIYQRVFLK
jgi:hypothetical protein